MKTRVRIFLMIQAALCILVTGLFISTAVSIYREGSARKAEHPLEEIYTREKAEETFLSLVPLVLCALGMTAAGRILGIKDDKADKPFKDSGFTCNSPADREGGRNNSTRIRAILIIAALVFIVMGILNGSAKDVLYKARNICTECIGLG